MLITYCSLLIAHCSLLIAHCSLLIAHCSLLIAHCSLLIAHCSLLIEIQPIPRAVHGLDPARLFRVRFNLAPQTGNMGVDRARGGKGGVAPHDIQKAVATDHL